MDLMGGTVLWMSCKMVPREWRSVAQCLDGDGGQHWDRCSLMLSSITSAGGKIFSGVGWNRTRGNCATLKEGHAE